MAVLLPSRCVHNHPPTDGVRHRQRRVRWSHRERDRWSRPTGSRAQRALPRATTRRVVADHVESARKHCAWWQLCRGRHCARRLHLSARSTDRDL